MTYKLFFDIIQLASIIIASGVALYGITAWRRETTWKRKYEISEEVLSLFYECKENFQVIRSPFSNSNEGTSRKKGENETDAETERLNTLYVFIERYEKVKDPFLKLSSLKFRFMALFGKSSEVPFNEIRLVLNEIFHAAHVLGQRYWKEQGGRNFSQDEFEKHLKEMHQKENIIWQSLNDDDLIAKRIDNCILAIESYCESIINKSN